jgi:hypothetical protein
MEGSIAAGRRKHSIGSDAARDTSGVKQDIRPGGVHNIKFQLSSFRRQAALRRLSWLLVQ